MNRSSLILLGCLMTVFLSTIIWTFSSKLHEEIPISKSHYDSGTFFLDKKMYVDAVGQFTMQLAEPSYKPTYKIYIFRGMAYLNLNNYPSALEDFDRAILLDPSMGEGHYIKCFTLLKLSDIDLAESSCLKAAETPGDVQSQSHIHSLLGDLYAYKDEWPKSVSHYQESLRLNPKNAESMNQLAWIMVTSREPSVANLEAGFKLAQQANELTQFSIGEIIDTLACAHAAKGNFKEATELAQKNNLDNRVPQFAAHKICDFDL